MLYCERCHKTYQWPDSLKRHMQIKHSDHIPSPMPIAQNAGHDADGPIQQPSLPKMADPIRSDVPSLVNTPMPFLHPFTMVVSGPTGSGKTRLVKEILEKRFIAPTPTRITWIYKRWQPLYEEMRRNLPNIQFIQGIPSNIDRDDFFLANQNNVIVLDDMMSTCSNDPKIADLFTEGSHHRNLSVINLTQNLFPCGKTAVTQRRNTQYMIVFKSPMSQDQIKILGAYIYPTRVPEFIKVYKQATDQPHGYLIIDAKQDTPPNMRLRTNQENIQRSHDEPAGVPPAIRPESGHNESYKTPEIKNNLQTSLDSRPVYDVKSDMNNCSDCGCMFDSNYDVQKHVKRGCPEADDSDDDEIHFAKRNKMDVDAGRFSNDESDENPRDEEPASYKALVQDTFDDLNDVYSDKVDSLMKRENVSETEARGRIDQEMLPQHRRLLRKKYAWLLTRICAIENTQLHKEIKRLVDRFVKRGTDLKEAVRRALKQKERLFDTLIIDDYDSEKNTSDVEEDGN